MSTIFLQKALYSIDESITLLRQCSAPDWEGLAKNRYEENRLRILSGCLNYKMLLQQELEKNASSNTTGNLFRFGF